MWNVFLKGKPSYKNVELIFPTQQRDVSTLVNSLKDNENVQRIVIFGSSVTSACNPWSDIDVYIELLEDVRLRLPKLENPVDLWTNFDVDQRLKREIDETGVIVFCREENYEGV